MYDLEKLDMRVIQFEPPSANYQHTMEQVGKYGKRFTETVIGERIIPFTIDVFASDENDIILQRGAFFNIFSSDEDFYVYDMRQTGIRWRVRAEQQPFGFYDNYYLGGDISFNLINASGYGESAGTTQTPFTYGSNEWSMGMNIPNEQLEYSFTRDNFTVKNLSTIPIRANERPYKITFKGSASNLTIKNVTTGQTFTLNTSITESDEFVLYGAWPFLNNKEVYSQGNHVFIDLKKGNNQFEISGYQKINSILFDTRFYYG